MTCKACIERGQTWAGDKPQCAFESGAFSPGNWNCATVNMIRDLVDEHAIYCDDEKYAVLNISELGLGDTGQAIALWVQWYKSRGRTQSLLLLQIEDAPRPPTEDECVAICRQATVSEQS